MNEETAAVTFTVDELWLLHRCVRFEIPQQDTWKHPPSSEALNEQIADALLVCDESKLIEYTLLLTRHDCLVLDATVSPDAATPGGQRIGKSVLLKSFAARRELAGGPMVGAEDRPSADVAGQLAAWRNIEEISRQP